MIIGIDASRAIRAEKTGVEWYARNIIENLLKIDKKNQYLLYCDDHPDEWLERMSREENVKIKRLHWGLPYLWTQGRLSLGMVIRRPDVLFIPASAMPILHPKKTVMTIHDVAFMRYPKSYRSQKLAYLKWSTQYAAKSAQKIITISEFSKQEIIKYFKVPADNITITPLACDQNLYRPINDQKKISRILNFYKISQPFLLFVGRLEDKKNITGLLKAFAKLKKAMPAGRQENKIKHKLVLVGSEGYGWREAAEFIKKEKLTDEVIKLGYVKQDNMPYIYNAAEAFVFPSRYEGFGLPVLEAMACGTPVICSRISSIPEVAGEAAVLADLEKEADLAENILKVISDERMRQNLAYKGLEQVKKFSWETCARQTLVVLEK